MLESLLDRLTEKKDEAERRRRELLESLERGEVADPFTATILGSTILAQIVGAVAISAVVSVGTALITRALTPRQKFTSGQLQGALQIPQSDQGLPITEGYGANPASNAGAFLPSHAYALEDRVVSGGYFYVVTTAGTSAASAPTFPTAKGGTVTSGTVTFTNYGRIGGGFRLPMLIVWTSGIRKHETTTSGQGGKGFLGPRSAETTTIEYDLDLAIMPGRGPLTIRRIKANTDTIYQNYVAPTVFYEAEDAGNTLTNASVITTSYASGGQTVQMNTSTGAVQFPGVLGSGSSTEIGIGYVASGSRTCQIWVNGSLATTVTLPGNDASLRWYVATVNIPETASNVVKLVNTSSAGGAILYLDRISVGGVSTPTGVPDPFIPVDVPYDPGIPPDPNTPYEIPSARYAGQLEEDAEGVLAGSIQAGSNASLSIYPGNDSQLPDPTMQAAVDALYGSGSTPAFRNRCLIMLRNFYLTKYGGAIPIIQTLAEHQTLDTFELICAHLSSRTGVLLTSDYDYSGLRRIFPRGFVVTPPYAPADIMEELARVYNVYFRESDKIYAFQRNSQAVVASLTSANLGWVDGDAEEEEGELPALDFDLATETEIARRYEMTFVDPDRDFDQNSQGISRQITSSEKTEKIELALTLYPEEAREIAQRELYEEHVESTKHRFDLDWSYLWLQPGDSVTIVEDDGTTSRIFLESFTPNIGVCPAEGSAEETAVYSQPVSTSGGVYEIPPVPIPGQTLVLFYDGPYLRDFDNTVNNGAGVYVGAYKRRGDGDFTGSALYVDRGLGYEQLETFEKEATAGVTASTLTDTTSVDGFVADALTVDLHDEDATLESFTRDDLLSGAGACIIGSEVCQILTATREPDTVTYPNRWYLVIGLRARRGTDFAVGTHVTGERFVLADDALKFVPLATTFFNTEHTFKMVTVGQSLDDAAEVTFVWTGRALKPLSPAHLRAERDSADNALILFDRRSRVAQNMRDYADVPVGEEGERFVVVIPDAVPPRTMEVVTGMSLAALLESSGVNKFSSITVNTLSLTTSGSSADIYARSVQRIIQTGNFVEGTLRVTSDGTVELGLINVTKDWRTAVADYRIRAELDGFLNYLRCYQGSTLIYERDISAEFSGGVWEKRVRITLSGSEARFYESWVGTGTPPLAVSQIPPTYPLQVRLYAGSMVVPDTVKIEKVVMTISPQPATIYSAAQATADGLTPAGPYTVRAAQVSAVVGPGEYAEEDL